MTPWTPTVGCKRAKTQAALDLQRRARMRSALAATLFLLPLVARAQTSGGGTPARGSCTGMLAGNVGLAVPQSNGSFLSIPAGTVPTVFGEAECQCSKARQNPNINLEIQLTQSFPTGTNASAQLWVGSDGCQDFNVRSAINQTQCEKVADLDGNLFVKGGATGGFLHFAIPADALASPVKRVCDPTQNAQAANKVWIFATASGNFAMPDATCQLALSERNQGPQGPSGASAAAGDGAVTVHWTAPATGSFLPSFFQVLCADDCGNPIKSKPSTANYSTCNNGVLQRRDLTSGGSGPGGPTPTDGGVPSGDGGTTLLSVGADPAAATPIPGCDADAGVPLGDGGAGPWADGLGPLSSLDPAYLCTGALNSGTTSTRIDGLQDGKTYHFVVVSIDQFGNATPSNLVTAKPQPTEDLYRRFRNAGGGAGHCFIATAAFGSYENHWVHILRDFRDTELLPHGWGQAFVSWYYAHSPPLADYIAAHAWARTLTRILLLPLIGGAWAWLHLPVAVKLGALLLLAALFWRRRLLHRGTSA